MKTKNPFTKSLLRSSVLALLILFSCSNGKAGGNISGKILGGNGKTLYIDKLTSSSLSSLDSVKLKADGNFSFNVVEKEVGFFRLRLEENNFTVIMLEPSSKVVLDAKAENLGLTATVKGSPDNEWLSNATRYLIKNGMRSDSLQKAAASIPDFQTNTTEQMRLQEIFYKMQEQENQMIRDYIKSHSSSLTCLALVERLDPDDNFQYFKMLDEGLMKSYPKSEFAKGFHERVSELSKLSVGSSAPEINLNNPDDVAIPLSSLKGKVVLIDFWASWCRPCRAENPNVVRLYNKYQSKGFEVYSVSLDKLKDAWIDAIAKDGLVWKSHVSDLAFWQSPVVKLYNISGIPMTYLIDKEGKIIGKGLRGEDLEKKLSEILD